jgi:flagellar assembly factor FliW
MSALVAEMPEDTLTLASDLLGSITIPAHEILRFPTGLYGFPECRSFAFLPTPREGMYWLQSADFSALSFLLVDPFQHFPQYHIDLDDSDIARLGTSDSQHILVLAIVTMPASEGAPCTANLNAPVLFNLRDRHAHQSIRPNGGYDIRAPFQLEG